MQLVQLSDLHIGGAYFSQDIFDTLDIAYAGTASSTRFRGFFKNTYNIVDIKDNGEVNIDIKVVGARRFPLIDIVKDYSPVPEI
jgi:hypothetical protein